MASKKFQRRKENFVCAHCSQKVTGNGYTNHCSNCLWSKHVDVNPGDRAEVCGGLMKPISFAGNSRQYYVVQECQHCGRRRRNKLAANDNLAALFN